MTSPLPPTLAFPREPDSLLRVLVFLFFFLPAAAQNLKLSGPLARDSAGELSFPPLTSPDGKFHVYSADREGDGVFELYSVQVGGKPARLAGPVPEYGLYPQIMLDGASVLFLADLYGNGLSELVRVPIDGSGPPKALADASAGYVIRFQQSPDGARVLYLEYPESSANGELFSVPSAGGTPVRLNGALVPGGNVQNFALSSTGLAAYSADQETDGRVELFVVPGDGSEVARKLPIPLVQHGSVARFQFDADGSHVIYTADQEADERYELFSVASDGSQPARKLSGSLGPGGDVGVVYPRSFPCWPYHCAPLFYPDFILSPDQQWVVYSANQDTGGCFELYGVPTDGGRAAVKLSVEPDANVFSYLSVLTPDSARVVYRPFLSREELFSVPIDGSTPAHLVVGHADPGGLVSEPKFSPDGSRVVFAADLDQSDVFELYSAPVDGSDGLVKLSAPLPTDGDVGVWGPAGFVVLAGGVAYVAEQEHNGLPELYLVPTAGGAAPRKLAVGPVASIDSGGSDAVLFRSRGALLSVQIDDADPAVVLDELPADGFVVGDVEGFDLDRAGERVVYHARQAEDVAHGLYSVQTSERPERDRFRIAPETPIVLERFVPDGSRVVFLTNLLDPGSSAGAAYSALSDGSADPVRLDDVQGDALTQWFELTSDGQRVVFQVMAEGHALLSAPVDGSAGPLLLHAFEAAGQPDGVRLDAKGSRAAFIDLAGLYTVPVDGSAPAVLVSGGGEPVSSPDFTADGHRVVFRMGAAPELFVAPADGSAPPRRLNPPLPFHGHVEAFVLSPDSARAIYLARTDTFELFSVRIDGSAPAVRLHPELSAPHAVLPDFQVSRDGQGVVYRADPFVDEQFELFSVPVDASRLPVRLSGTLVPGGDVLDFGLSPDGARVVYRADAYSDQVFELFATPIQGSRRPARLSRPIVPGGDVRSFRISATERRLHGRARHVGQVHADAGVGDRPVRWS